ncbi:ABC transporter substrate-binding protein [Paenibacillus sp. GCM10012307]|uniref:Carbohydrate ABC transporter substrate-binding protein n=1 Tax=Paenibacillus roseus TaxID=2798579 RepID=A0A934JA83_9BACL|nr:carbohydrate ABC transporter substrate-binding protein [Paenibacillus roseus]
MSRKRYYIMLLSLLMLFIVVGFPMAAGPTNRIAKWTGAEPEKVNQTTAADENIIKFMDVNVSISSSEFADLQKLTLDFTAKHPDIKVKLVNLPAGDTYERLKQGALLGEAPDIMLLDNSWVIDFAASGYLKNVDSMFAGETFSDVPAGLLQPLKWNSFLWGVPKDADPLLTVWSAVLLKGAGGEPLSLPHNISELELLAEAIDAADNNKTPESRKWAAFAPDSLKELLVWASAFQGADGDPANMAHLPSKQEELLRNLDSMRMKGMLLVEADSSRLLDHLLNGNLLSAVLPLSKLYANWSSYAGKLVVQNQASEQPLWLNGRSYTLSAKTKWPQEAKAWIEYVTDPLHQEAAFISSGKLPARKSAYEAKRLDPISASLHERLEQLTQARMDANWHQQYIRNGQLWGRWLNGEIGVDGLLDQWE